MAGNFQSWLVYQEKNNGEFGKLFFQNSFQNHGSHIFILTDVGDEIWGWQPWIIMKDPTPFVTSIRKMSPI